MAGEIRIHHTLHSDKVQALFIPHTGTYNDVLRRAIKVQNGARRRAPVDTGRLRSGIHVEAPYFTRGVAGAAVVCDVEYAIYQEFGTRYMPGRHFLRDSVQDAGS